MKDLIFEKIIIFADDYNQFEEFKKNEKFFDSDLMVYFHNPDNMMVRMFNCIVLDIRKTDKDQEHLDFINNFPKWKKIN